MKKSKKSNLETKRSIFFQIGIIISLSLVLMAFKWSITNENSFRTGISNNETYYEELPPITKIEPIKRPQPPKTVESIEVVKDDVKIDDKYTIPDIDIDVNDTVDIFVYIPEEEVVDVIPFYAVEITPKFLDGKDATLLKWLTEHSEYPSICVENNISGTVWVSFVINNKGKVTNVSLLRSVNTYLDNEAIRLISSMPDWKPGIQAGKYVSVPYQLPVKFTLE